MKTIPHTPYKVQNNQISLLVIPICNLIAMVSSRGPCALNGPKSMLLLLELKVMRSNLIGPIKLKEHGQAFQPTFPADKKFNPNLKNVKLGHIINLISRQL